MFTQDRKGVLRKGEKLSFLRGAGEKSQSQELLIFDSVEIRRPAYVEIRRFN